MARAEEHGPYLQHARLSDVVVEAVTSRPSRQRRKSRTSGFRKPCVPAASRCEKNCPIVTRCSPRTVEAGWFATGPIGSPRSASLLNSSAMPPWSSIPPEPRAFVSAGRNLGVDRLSPREIAAGRLPDHRPVGVLREGTDR